LSPKLGALAIIRQVIGDRLDRLSIRPSASSVVFVTSIALKDVFGRMNMGILQEIFTIVKDVAFVLPNAGQGQ